MTYFARRTRVHVVTAGVTAAVLGVVLLPSSSALTADVGSSPVQATVSARQQAAAPAPGAITSKVRGTFGRAGTVRGRFSPDRFFVRGGEPMANGVLHATLRRGDGSLVGRVTRRITIPVRDASNPSAAAAARATTAEAQATCDILHLVLGPLDLDLLGLEVHLNRVVLDIVAVTGAGNLLGNLLCAVVGLLDGTGALSNLRLVNVLNRILAILRVG